MDVVLTVVAATAAEGNLSSFTYFDHLFHFHGGYILICLMFRLKLRLIRICDCFC